MSAGRPDSPDHELSLADYGRALWAGRTIILVCVAIAAVVGLALTFVRSTVYTGTAQVYLGQATTPSGVPVTLPATNPTTAPTVLEGDEIVEAVAEEVGISPNRVRSGVTLSTPRAPGSAGNLPTLVRVTFSDESSRVAEEGANSYAAQIVEFNRRVYGESEDVYARQVARAEAEIARLTRQVAELEAGGLDSPSSQTVLILAQENLAAAQGRLDVAEVALASTRELSAPEIVSEARAPSSSSSGPARVRTVLLAAAIGLVIGVILAFIWYGRSRRAPA